MVAAILKVKILENPTGYDPAVIEAAEKYKKKYPILYAKAKLQYTLDMQQPKFVPSTPALQKIVKDRDDNAAANRTKSPSFWRRLFSGGSVSTKNKTKYLSKTNHKSNHKSKHKAKTQSKPKHKNKSKLNAKPKPKTIKKNKRAHHKFDKKYTRKH